MRVRVNNTLTKPFRHERGVRQGCPTSPLIFKIFINDLLDKIRPIRVEGIPEGIKGLMFADDTVILADSESDLNQKLTLIDKWMKENHMEINPSKCGIMDIKSNDNTNLLGGAILFNGEEIPIVDTYTHLGIEFNSQLDLSAMAKFRLEKGKGVLDGLTPALRNGRLPLEYKVMLIRNILVSSLTYGVEIFGMNQTRVNPLKRVLDNGLKCILRRSNFCRLRAYEELNLESIYTSSSAARARGISKWTKTRGLKREHRVTKAFQI